MLAATAANPHNLGIRHVVPAIPFFIVSSAFLSTGGVAKRIIRFALSLVVVAEPLEDLFAGFGQPFIADASHPRTDCRVGLLHVTLLY